KTSPAPTAWRSGASATIFAKAPPPMPCRSRSYWYRAERLFNRPQRARDVSGSKNSHPCQGWAGEGETRLLRYIIPVQVSRPMKRLAFVLSANVVVAGCGYDEVAKTPTANSTGHQVRKIMLKPEVTKEIVTLVR